MIHIIESYSWPCNQCFSNLVFQQFLEWYSAILICTYLSYDSMCPSFLSNIDTDLCSLCAYTHITEQGSSQYPKRLCSIEHYLRMPEIHLDVEKMIIFSPYANAFFFADEPGCKSWVNNRLYTPKLQLLIWRSSWYKVDPIKSYLTSWI